MARRRKIIGADLASLRQPVRTPAPLTIPVPADFLKADHPEGREHIHHAAADAQSSLVDLLDALRTHPDCFALPKRERDQIARAADLLERVETRIALRRAACNDSDDRMGDLRTEIQRARDNGWIES